MERIGFGIGAVIVAYLLLSLIVGGSGWFGLGEVLVSALLGKVWGVMVLLFLEWLLIVLAMGKGEGKVVDLGIGGIGVGFGVGVLEWFLHRTGTIGKVVAQLLGWELGVVVAVAAIVGGGYLIFKGLKLNWERVEGVIEVVLLELTRLRGKLERIKGHPFEKGRTPSASSDPISKGQTGAESPPSSTPSQAKGTEKISSIDKSELPKEEKGGVREETDQKMGKGSVAEKGEKEGKGGEWQKGEKGTKKEEKKKEENLPFTPPLDRKVVEAASRMEKGRRIVRLHFTLPSFAQIRPYLEGGTGYLYRILERRGEVVVELAISTPPKRWDGTKLGKRLSPEELILGEDWKGEPIIWDFEKAPSLLGVGKGEQSGEFFRNLFRQLVANHSAEELQIGVIDTGGVLAGGEFPHLWRNIARTEEEGLSLLIEIGKELQFRIKTGKGREFAPLYLLILDPLPLHQRDPHITQYQLTSLFRKGGSVRLYSILWIPVSNYPVTDRLSQWSSGKVEFLPPTPLNLPRLFPREAVLTPPPRSLFF